MRESPMVRGRIVLGGEAERRQQTTATAYGAG